MESIRAGFAGELRGGKLQNSIFILADVWRTVSEGVKQKPKAGRLFGSCVLWLYSWRPEASMQWDFGRRWLASSLSLFPGNLPDHVDFPCLLCGPFATSSNPFVFSSFYVFWDFFFSVINTSIVFSINQNLPLSLPHLQDYFNYCLRLTLRALLVLNCVRW